MRCEMRRIKLRKLNVLHLQLHVLISLKWLKPRNIGLMFPYPKQNRETKQRLKPTSKPTLVIFVRSHPKFTLWFKFFLSAVKICALIWANVQSSHNHIKIAWWYMVATMQLNCFSLLKRNVHGNNSQKFHFAILKQDLTKAMNFFRQLLV